MTEQWRPIPGFGGLYEASDQGRIVSRNNTTGEPRLMLGSINRWRGGYRVVRLPFEGRTRTFHWHSLICLAFYGPRPEGLEVRHLNGTPGDNRLENLRYGTRSENGQDTLKHGRNWWASKTHCPKGHEYLPGNLVGNGVQGGRRCAKCKAAMQSRPVVCSSCGITTRADHSSKHQRRCAKSAAA